MSILMDKMLQALNTWSWQDKKDQRYAGDYEEKRGEEEEQKHRANSVNMADDDRDESRHRVKIDSVSYLPKK